MRSMKRVQLAVVFLTVGALVAGTSVFAGKIPRNPDRLPGGATCNLTPAGDEPGASGQAKLSNVWRFWTSGFVVYWGDLGVTCKGLTPGEKY